MEGMVSEIRVGEKKGGKDRTVVVRMAGENS